MPKRRMKPPLHPIHPRTYEISGGTPVVIRDARGDYHSRIAATGVVEGGDFLVVWVARPEEVTRALRDGDTPDQVPWPAEDVPRLVAALEAVLKLADGATILLSACGVSGRCSCGEHPVAWDLDPAKVCAAITREITGKGEPGA